MTKRLLCLFMVVALMAIFMAGCGSADKSADMRVTSKPEMNSSGMESDAYSADDATAEGSDIFDADSLAGGGSTVNVSNAILAERKIIRSADLTIEVENFDNAFANIEAIIANIGFIQQTNINTDRVYVGDEVKLVRNGTIVLRVDKTMFDSVINKLRGLGDVYNYTTNGQDVTDQYIDVESRLRLLKMQQEKLEAYVAKLDDIEEIYKAESKLTELRYQIESLTGNLNKLSSLVELSTITINLNEKRPGEQPKPETYGDKLVNSLKESLLNVVDFLGDLLLFIVAALPVLIFIGLCVLFGMWIYRKTIKKRRNGSGYTKSSAYPGGPAAYHNQSQPVPPVPPVQGTAPGPHGVAPDIQRTGRDQQGAAQDQKGTAAAPEKKQPDESGGKKQ
jgi:hypothetical protein